MKLSVAILNRVDPSMTTCWGVGEASRGLILLAVRKGRGRCLVKALALLADVDPLEPDPIWRFSHVIPIEPFELAHQADGVPRLFELDMRGKVLEVDHENSRITISFDDSSIPKNKDSALPHLALGLSSEPVGDSPTAGVPGAQ
jgi:hypothetical protein